MSAVSLSVVLALMAVSAPPRDDAAIAPAENDPRMIAAYEQVVAYLKPLNSYELSVRLDWQVEGDAQGQTGSNLYRFQLQRPRKFRLEVRPGDRPEPSLIVVSDGTTATTLYTPKTLYSQVPLVENPAEGLERNPIVAMSLSGSLIDTLMRPDLVEVVKSHATGGKRTGTEDVDGRELDRFTLSWRGDEEELWIGPEAEPLPRKLVRILTVPTPDGQATRLVTTATLDWTINPEIPAETFTLALPEEARKVEDIYTALASGTTASLLGSPAPELDLKRLDGGNTTLAFHKGRDVVLLDFWASWCVPCLDLMPKLNEVLDASGRQEVVHYAINVGEEVAEIREFLQQHALKLNVVLDPDGRATDAYGVTSIPALVLIGKDGTVQAVHQGAGETVIDAIRDELGALLDGQSLVEAP